MSAAAEPEPLLDLVLGGKYRIVRPIGRGGMGAVYEAEHVQLGKRVAVKLMLDKYAQDGEAMARFHREALAASRIGNDHIIDVQDLGTASDGRPYVVMELLHGVPLTAALDGERPMRVARAVAIMRQVLRAVGAAHARGIIHRDLKPDNIFLVEQQGRADYVKLLDFGISKVIDRDEQVAFTKLTSTGVVMGTPLYMSPEQAMGQSAEAAADIYACGVMLYELLAGRPPFDGHTYAVLVARMLTAEPENLGKVRPGLPAGLVRAVHRALDKEPANRFASAEEFAAALPDDAAMTPARGSRPVARKTWWLAGLALAVAALATGGWIATRPGDEAAPPASSLPVAAPAHAVQSGVLEVKTVPTGAAVAIDGQPEARAPVRVTLTPGLHVVRVALDGFDSFESDVEIHAGSTTAVMLPLVRAAPAQLPATPAKIKAPPPRPKITTHPTPPETTKTTPPVPEQAPEPPPSPLPVSKDKGSKPNPYTKPNPY